MAVGSKVWERSRHWVLFLALFSVSAGLFLFNDAPALRAARSASLTVTAPLERVFSGVGKYKSALSENDRLRAESIELASEVARLREARAENERLRSLLAFGDTLAYPRIPARVVAKDITQQENLLTISVGEADSVKVGMPVVDERGIIGKIVLTSANYSLVMPHQSTQFAVPATIDALQQDGIVRWDGVEYDRLLMEYVPKTEDVEVGQLVTTSGYSGVYPAGIPVGTVDSVFAGRGRNDYILYLRPAAPISQANYLYVLLIEQDAEIDALRAQADAARNQ